MKNIRIEFKKSLRGMAAVTFAGLALISLTACTDTINGANAAQSPQGTTVTQAVQTSAPNTNQLESQPTQAQAATSEGLIGMDAALQAALDNASLTADQVTVVKQQQGKDDGIDEYEIDFIHENTKYEYEIDASTGGILQFSQQPVTDYSNIANGQDGNLIGMDAAKQAALNHAGISESDVVFTKVKLEYDDGIAEYNIGFIYNGMEYEYEINASTGVVTDFEMETSKAGWSA